MKKKVNPRFAWAIEQMGFDVRDTVLEIGPGTGIALEMIASIVSAGSVLALDQSEGMLRKAGERLARTSLPHRVRYMKGDVATVDLAGNRFSKVFAFNVNVFLKGTDISHVLETISQDGTIGVFFQNPPGSDPDRLAEMLQTAQSFLRKAGFECASRPVHPQMEATPTGGVIARRC